MFPIRDSLNVRSFSFATKLIVLICIVLFFNHFFTQVDQLQLVKHLSLVPKDAWPLKLETAYTLITHTFVHANLAHLIGNVWTLWIFGNNVEDKMGFLRFISFYLLCGVGAAFTQMLFAPGSSIPMVGASGAISGVMGAYLLLFPKSKITLMVPIFIFPYFFQLPAFVFLVFWFLFQFLSGAQSLLGPKNVGGIAWWAHIGGFLIGILTFWMFLKRRK